MDTDDLAAARLAERLRPWFGEAAGARARRMLMWAETPGNWLVTLFDALGLDGRMMGLTDRLRRRR
ncbi:MAG: hypothetical protein ACRDHL_09280, partial [Candidatus Promineifilaceae bacterium]